MQPRFAAQPLFGLRSSYTGDTSDHEGLRLLLGGRRAAIVEQLRCALSQTGFALIGAAEINRQLMVLVDRCIGMLLAEQVDRAGAEAVGSTIAEWHFIQPDVLGTVQGVLLRSFTTDLPLGSASVLMPNLIALIEGFSVGYMRRAQEIIIREKEQILCALLTEHMNVTEALRISEERLRAIISHLPIIVFSINQEGIITLVEGQCPALGSCDPSMLIGQSVFTLVRTRPQFLANLRRALAGEAVTDILAIEPVVFETRFAPLHGPQGAVEGLIGVAMDVTERRRMEIELHEARYLIAESREDERRQLARDLHDGVVQQLLGFSYQLLHAQRRAAGAPPAQLTDELLATQKLVQQGLLDVVGQLRSSISELRPIGLDDLGLTTALETLVTKFEQEPGGAALTIERDLDWVGTDLTPAVARCLFRVAQEALRNIVRHAQASHAAVILRRHAETVMLCVIDDGVGFEPPPQLTQFSRAQHFGLVGLLEQVECLYGQLAIWSEPGGGTEVTVELPVAPRWSKSPEHTTIAA
jgi:PAS domain S-box-containing protein